MALVLVEGGDKLPGIVGPYDNSSDRPASLAPVLNLGYLPAVIAAIFASFIVLGS